MNSKNIGKKGLATSLVLGSLLVGGLAGTVLSAGKVSAQATTVTPATINDSNGHVGSGGKFRSNEDSAHELKESPEREAQEDAGQFSPQKNAPSQ